MSTEYRVKLYRIDGEQAVDIPPELALPGDEVIMYREGERLIIVPKGQHQPPTESSSIDSPES